MNNGVVYLDFEDSHYHGPLLCLGVGAWLKVNTRALGRGVLHKVDSISLSLTSEHTGRTRKQFFTRSV